MHSILRQPVNGFGSIRGLSPADSEVRAKEGLWADPSFTSNATVTKKYKCGASDAALESRAPKQCQQLYSFVPLEELTCISQFLGIRATLWVYSNQDKILVAFFHVSLGVCSSSKDGRHADLRTCSNPLGQYLGLTVSTRTLLQHKASRPGVVVINVWGCFPA